MAVALVTGVTGQDGSYLAEALAANGDEVHGLVRPGDRKLSALQALVPSLVAHPADLGALSGVDELLERVGPDEVYHLGAASAVTASWTDPLTTHRVNTTATATLLDALHRWSRRTGRTPRFLLASSAEVFGAAAPAPQSESTPLAPDSPYGASKAYGQLLVGAYRNRGLHASSAVLFTHESPRRPRSFLSAKVAHGVAAIAAGRTDHLVLGNLDVARDWGWAPDHVAATVLALRHDTPRDWVVATGESHPVRDLVAGAFAHAGLDWHHHVRTDPGLTRPGEAREQRGDATRAREVLGWAPTVGFDELVHRLVDAARDELDAAS